MDKNITEQELNDFGTLKATCPQLGLVCFNGQKAGESEELLRSLGYVTLVLPVAQIEGIKRSDYAVGMQFVKGECWERGEDCLLSKTLRL
jgi:G:T/U-mismatch repair DNA glycosylase